MQALMQAIQSCHPTTVHLSTVDTSDMQHTSMHVTTPTCKCGATSSLARHDCLQLPGQKHGPHTEVHGGLLMPVQAHAQQRVTPLYLQPGVLRILGLDAAHTGGWCTGAGPRVSQR